MTSLYKRLDARREKAAQCDIGDQRDFRLSFEILRRQRVPSSQHVYSPHSLIPRNRRQLRPKGQYFPVRSRADRLYSTNQNRFKMFAADLLTAKLQTSCLQEGSGSLPDIIRPDICVGRYNQRSRFSNTRVRCRMVSLIRDAQALTILVYVECADGPSNNSEFR